MPRISLALAALAVTVAAACGAPSARDAGSPRLTSAQGTPSGRVPAYTHDGDNAIVTYAATSGMALWRDPHSLVDALTLAGDGTLVMAGPPDAKAALQPLTVTTVERGAVDDLMRGADASRLLDRPDLGTPGTVMDAATVVVTITADGVTRRTEAYALDEEFDDAVTPQQAKARAALRAFVADLLALQATGTPYAAPAIAVYRVGNPWLPEPGDPADGSTRAWPLPAKPRPFAADQDETCLLVEAGEAEALRKTLDGATTETTWRIPGEPSPATLLFRPLVPGDPGCSRTIR